MVKSSIEPLQPINYFDYNASPNSHFVHFIENSKELETIIVYVYGGKGEFADGGETSDDPKKKKWLKVKRKDTLIWDSKKKGEALEFRVGKDEKEDLGFLLLMGKPIREVSLRKTLCLFNARKLFCVHNSLSRGMGHL